MSGAGELRHYRVVARGAAPGCYRVRHRATGRLHTWRAADCSSTPAERLRTIIREVHALSELHDDALVKYHDTIFHKPTKTLYLVLEDCEWRTLEEIARECREGDLRMREGFLWYLLHELSRACKLVFHLTFTTLQKSISASTILIDESGEIRINFFDVADPVVHSDLMRQIGQVLYDLCYLIDKESGKVKHFCYSDDLKDVISFFLEDSNCSMKPDVILYHPTVLANLENTMGSKKLSDVIVSRDFIENIGDSSKCDSEKALEVCKTIERKSFTLLDSPFYTNVSPKRMLSVSDHNISSPKTSLSPTLAALALELPGFVPRRQTMASNALARNEPQQISQRTLSNQWLSRLIALREREDNLNRRERDLISKEIVNSPNVKIAAQDDVEVTTLANEGITLPPVISQNRPVEAREDLWISRRHHRRASSVKPRQRRRHSYNYEDMDSSLSADPGDGSVIVTATKFNKDNMPRRNIFPEVSTKKVHFTSVNPFAESDESVTLTFYELENMDAEGYQVPRNREYTTNKMAEEISKFKYLDLEKATLEKRAAMDQRNQSSPSKQAKFAVPTNPEKKFFNDITNRAGYSMKKVPSKTSVSSKTSTTSNGTKYSTASSLSTDSNKSSLSYLSCVSSLRSSTRLKNADKLFTQQSKPITRQSMLPMLPTEDLKKPKGRKSMLPFKTPFKFMTSSKS